MIYGNKFLPKEYDIRSFTESEVEYIVNYINEHNTIVLNEKTFSKKELQDPDMLNNLLDKFKKSKAVLDKIETASLILTIAEAIVVGVLTKSLGLGLLSLVAVTVVKLIGMLRLEVLISKSNEKKILQLKEQAIKLKEKSLKSDDSKAKEIVSNCEKLIKKIDKYFGSKEKAIYDQKYKYTKEQYLDVINAWFGKGVSANYSYIAKKIKLSKQDVNKIFFNNLDKYMKDSEKGYGSIWDLFFGNDDRSKIDDKDFEHYIQDNNDIPELKDNGKVCIIYAIDDTVLLYSPKAKKFFYGDYLSSTAYTYLLDISSKYEGVETIDVDDDILKAVDADLGYYRLSEPPKGVKPKKIL